MNQWLEKISVCLIFLFLLTACNGGRHPQSWQPKNHKNKKTTSKTPPAYQRQAY